MRCQDPMTIRAWWLVHMTLYCKSSKAITWKTEISDISLKLFWHIHKSEVMFDHSWMYHYFDSDIFSELFEPVHITGLNNLFTNWSDFRLNFSLFLTKIYNITSEASEFNAQATLLWYIFIVLFSFLELDSPSSLSLYGKAQPFFFFAFPIRK